jgi:3,4-dihydroxy 2-butanone 4-phosphate synthase/GTP cyclohydrolase II
MGKLEDKIAPVTGAARGQSLTVEGMVVHGDRRGRDLGFPTANLELADGQESELPDGVWAGRCLLSDGKSFAAAISIGRRPTFYSEVGSRLLEAHLLDFDGDLYGHRVAIHLDQWIRGQSAFASTEELIEALKDDVARTRALTEAR